MCRLSKISIGKMRNGARSLARSASAGLLFSCCRLGSGLLAAESWLVVGVFDIFACRAQSIWSCLSRVFSSTVENTGLRKTTRGKACKRRNKRNIFFFEGGEVGGRGRGVKVGLSGSVRLA